MSVPNAVVDYENMFEWAPVSLWLEDYSAIKQLFDGWRAQGVVDLRAHFRQFPDLLLQCSRSLQVIRVNRQTLLLLAAKSQTELVTRLPEIFGADTLVALTAELDYLWQGCLHFSKETVNYALDGRRIHAEIHVRVLPGYEDTWDRVMVTFDDITARKEIAANLEYVSTHDALTGLYNRAFYATELKRVAQHGLWPLCVVTMDLNGLKRINDAHGHAAGDAVLKRVGEVLRQARTDANWSMVRTGGDEFVALLPGCNESMAQTLITRIESLVAASNASQPDHALSLSMGMASCDASGQVDETLHQADQRMFAAKTLFYEMAHLERRRF